MEGKPCVQGMPGSYPSNYMAPPAAAPPVGSPGILPGGYAAQGSPYSSSYPMWNPGDACMLSMHALKGMHGVSSRESLPAARLWKTVLEPLATH